MRHPVANFTYTPAVGCPGQNITFTDTSTPDTTLVSWLWNFGDGNTSTIKNPAHAYQNSGTYTVTLEVTNVLGCTHMVTKTNIIRIFQRPNAAFVPTDSSACTPFSLPFFNTSTQTDAPLTAYRWNFGDGSTSTLPNPGHTFTQSGVFGVRLIAIDGNGCRDTVVHNITALALPTPAFSASDSLGCAPKTITFVDQSLASSPIVSWNWTFGDGGSSNAKFPVHTYVNDGEYDVSLRTVDANGCENTLVRPRYIKLSHPVADFAKSANQICTGTVVSFTDLSTADTTIQTWLWNFGDGTTSGQKNPTHVYSAGGTYSVTLTITNIFGCSDQITKTGFVSVLPGPNTLFSPSLPAGCTPFSPTFTDQSTGTTSPVVAWSWTFGDGGVSTAQNPTHTYLVPGIYDVTLTTTDNNGCVSSFTRQVESLELPNAKFFSNDTLGCAPQAVSFVDISKGPAPIVSWRWNFGNGMTSTIQNPTLTYANDGRFTVSLIAVDQNGCRDTATRVEYIRLSNPQPNFSLSQPNGCPGMLVKFTDLSLADTTIVSWLWTFGDGSTSIVRNPSKVYPNPGLYTVSLTVTNVNGCSKTYTLPNAVSVATLPTADFLLADSISCTPFLLDISDNTTTVSSPIVAWNWTFGNGDNSNDQEPIYTYYTPGSYQIRFRVTDANGCTDSVMKTVIATEAPRPSFSQNDSVGCSPFTVKFTDRTRASYPITGWLWNFGDGTTSTVKNPTHTYLTDGIYTVSLTVFDNNNCQETFTKEDLIRLSHPVAGFDNDIQEGCAGSTVIFTDRSVGDTTLTGWFWDFGDGGQTVVQNPSYTYFNSAQYDVTLIVTNVLGCRDTVRKSNLIEIFEKPIASFASTDTADCYPFQSNFNDFSSSAYGVGTWEWSVNGQLRSISQNFSYFFDTVGVYQVKLRVTDANGCQDSMIQKIYRHGIPVVAFFASDTIGCAPEAISFLDRSFPTPRIWDWSFGDGNTSNQQNPVHTYQNDGIYTVKLRITDQNGCFNEITKVNYIELDHPEIDFTVDYEAGCPPLPVTFRTTGSGLAGFANWRWDFGDGKVTTSLRDSIIYAYPAAGEYDVTLTVTDSLGCQSTVTKPAIVSVLGDIIPDPIKLHAVSVLDDDKVEVKWQPHADDDFLKYTVYRENPGQGFSAVYETYYVNDTLWIEDRLLTTDNSYCYRVTVTNFCGTESELNLTKTHCTINVEATPTPGQILVEWSPYIGWIAVAQYEVYRVNSYNPQDVTFIGIVPGTINQFSEEIEDCFNDYFYRIKATGPGDLQESWSDTALAVNFHGTVGRATQLVRATVEQNRDVLVEWKAFELPGAEFLYVEKQFEAGPWTVLTTLTPNNLKFLDQDANVQTTSYSYRVSAQDSCGNYTPLSNIGKTIVAKVEKDGITPLIRWTPYEEWTYGVDRYRIEVFVDTVGQWRIVDRVDGHIHEYYDTQTNFDQPEYCYRVIAEEQGGNRSTSMSNESCIDILSNIRVPNAFTPNLDGINDEWKASGIHIQTFHLQIFSRWGMLLFESYDPEIGWDGTYRGQPVGEGVYTYVIRGTSYNGAPFIQKGGITLMR
ncbi:MAG: PKD domain-containing protein [Bacteroidia bacterium]|nr:PKD domain-containing protein [Bacteroidia bacterium]